LVLCRILVGPKTARLPLIVALSRWRVNLGFAAGVVVLFACGHPTTRAVLGWLPLVLAGLALRVWARGHLTLRTRLAETGPYAFVRHPLYVGSFFAGLAFTLMMHDVWIAAVYVVAFVAMYVPKAIREERHVAQLYGETYARYAARVGAVVPRLGSLRAGGAKGAGFAWPQVLRHREYEAWLGAAAASAILLARAVWFA
jgi:protein-S-isoprenylcysteine O-methyltransferase Ste14